MPRRVHLGIDAGTQSTKAVLLDAETASIVAVGRSEHPPLDTSSAAREQDPDLWIRAATEAVRGALRTPDAADVEVAGVGVSGQQHGLVTLDADDRPVRPAKLWNDTTTADDAAALTARLGGASQVIRLTGNTFLPGYTAPALGWLIRVEPEAYRRTKRICLPHDYINLWLTGEYATEPGDASGTAYFDAQTRTYADRVLGAIDPARDWPATLPPVVPSRSVVGTLRPAVADSLGLPAGIPVSAGGGDNMCAAIGAGVTRPGPFLLSLGTSGTIATVLETPLADRDGEAALFCDSTGAWLPLGCILNCSAPIDWVRGMFGLDHAGVDAALAASPAGARGLTFLPYLAGERTPPRPGGSGAFHGLRLDHGRADVVRAVVEGVTFSLLYAKRAVERTGATGDRALLVGGGAASDPWAQLLADALEVPVHRVDLPEAAAAGAALQVRWVVDGATPEPARASASFEPRPSDALRDAIAAAEMYRTGAGSAATALAPA